MSMQCEVGQVDRYHFLREGFHKLLRIYDHRSKLIRKADDVSIIISFNRGKEWKRCYSQPSCIYETFPEKPARPSPIRTQIGYV